MIRPIALQKFSFQFFSFSPIALLSCVEIYKCPDSVSKKYWDIPSFTIQYFSKFLVNYLHILQMKNAMPKFSIQRNLDCFELFFTNIIIVRKYQTFTINMDVEL